MIKGRYVFFEATEYFDNYKGFDRERFDKQADKMLIENLKQGDPYLSNMGLIDILEFYGDVITLLEGELYEAKQN
jgi:hypothetical protein